ncbi:GIY-YIG nuclease family protein [Capilliphycus salinus ALCB114379]|uniref:GIY-YIG nuclease family protein n=1 Tax=Capilliphycus salinus TaxID=2768948 RepID=UPI0039A6EF7F
MTTQAEIPTLASLDSISYINEQGQLPETFQGKIGVYAIFDRDQVLQYIGYSRDIYLSLKQHLVRQPQSCYWIKVQTIERPSRTILEEIRQAWIAENGSIPAGNSEQSEQWNQPINVKPLMTDEENNTYNNLDGIDQEKHLRQVARRIESQILELLKARGLQEEIRFNPKLKTDGLLDLK